MKLENYALQAEPLKSRRALTANLRRIPMITHGCLSSLVLFTVLCVGCGDGADDPPPRMVQLWILNLSQECVATAAYSAGAGVWTETTWDPCIEPDLEASEDALNCRFSGKSCGFFWDSVLEGRYDLEVRTTLGTVITAMNIRLFVANADRHEGRLAATVVLTEEGELLGPIDFSDIDIDIF